MSPKLLFSLSIALFLSACGGYVTNTTVEQQSEPPSRTMETMLKSEEVGNVAGEHIHNYMKDLAAKVETSEGITLVPYKEGFRVIVNSGLLFAEESHTLKDAPKCEAVIDAIKKSPHTKYLLEIHTDGIGSRYYNQFLSERRAESLKDKFKEMNFPMERLVVRAYGEDQPIAENSYEWGKYLNRRVEIGVFASQELKQLAANGPVH